MRACTPNGRPIVVSLISILSPYTSGFVTNFPIAVLKKNFFAIFGMNLPICKADLLQKDLFFET